MIVIESSNVRRSFVGCVVDTRSLVIKMASFIRRQIWVFQVLQRLVPLMHKFWRVQARGRLLVNGRNLAELGKLNWRWLHNMFIIGRTVVIKGRVDSGAEINDGLKQISF